MAVDFFEWTPEDDYEPTEDDIFMGEAITEILEQAYGADGVEMNDGKEGDGVVHVLLARIAVELAQMRVTLENRLPFGGMPWDEE